MVHTLQGNDDNDNHMQRPCRLLEDSRAGVQACKRTGGCKGTQASTGSGNGLACAYWPRVYMRSYHSATTDMAMVMDMHHTMSTVMIIDIGVGVQAVVWSRYRADGASYCASHGAFERVFAFTFVCTPIYHGTHTALSMKSPPSGQ